MIEWLVFGFLLLGAVFILISALGLLRLKDVYMRMHATTKTTSFGLVMILIGAVIAMPEIANIIKGILIIVFTFLTVPLGTHMISKANYMRHSDKPDYYVSDDMTNEEKNSFN